MCLIFSRSYTHILYQLIFYSEEDINFFPVKMRDGRQELSDTFSIENLPLSGGEEDEDDLDLLPPQKSHRKWGCCGISFSASCSII